MQETELKFELTSAGAVRLLERNPFAAPPAVLEQKSIYFDTSEWDLSKRGLSLRIRQSGNERRQTLKAGDGVAAGTFVRQEWEQMVVDNAPVLDDPSVRALLADAGSRLMPLFEVHIKRHHWNLADGDAMIDVALDLGKILTADREAPICEIEFEMKAGSVASLFALARRIDLITPAHLGGAEQGGARLSSTWSSRQCLESEPHRGDV